MFCVNCGSALSAGTGAGGPPAAPMYPGAMPGLPSPWDAERRKQIGRTKTGVLLLLVGTLIGWLPYIGVLGFVLVFVGAILVILGRKAFGASHSRNVILSIVLVILGIIITVAAGVVLLLATVSSFIPGNAPTPAAITSAFNNFLIILVVGTIVTGLASVFFTFAIQNQTGRMLLLGAYVANIAIQIAIFVIVSQAVGTFVAAMFPNGNYSPGAAGIAAADFSARVQTIGYLSAIPALLYAAAYYLVWNRINKGEIPASTAPPSMAAAPLPPR
jgi:hypothetical protein